MHIDANSVGSFRRWWSAAAAAAAAAARASLLLTDETVGRRRGAEKDGRRSVELSCSRQEAESPWFVDELTFAKAEHSRQVRNRVPT